MENYLENKMVKGLCEVAPFAIMALGLYVLFGWYIHSEAIVSVIPGAVAMQPNTALCFVLIGMTARLCQTGYADWANAPGLLCGLIGAATLYQYEFGVNLGIDTLFVAPFTVDQTASPGRMAPNTAACFVLSSIAFHDINRTIKTTLYATMLVLGVLTVIGHIMGVTALYDWGDGVTGMAVHTGGGLALVGIAGIGCYGTRVQSFKQWYLGKRREWL